MKFLNPSSARKEYHKKLRHIAEHNNGIIFTSLVLWVLGIAVLLWIFTERAWGASYLISINLVILGAMAWDKAQAEKSGWRIPNSYLVSGALLGGAIGAIIGIFLFGHKKSYSGFVFLFGLFAFIYSILLWRIW